MKKFLSLVALLVFFGQSCQSPGQKKALDYNNKLANISKANQDKWKAIGEEINAAEKSHDYQKLTTLTNDLISFLDQKITEVNTMENPPGGEELKEAALEFLRFEKRTADETVKPYTLMNEQTTPEEFQTATQALLEAAKSEEPYLVKLQDAQRGFAKKNGFKLQETK